MNIDDKKIKDLIFRVEFDIPAPTDRKTSLSIKNKLNKQRSFSRKLIFALTPVVISLILSFLLIYPLFKNTRPNEKQISEIRTEFYIKDINIKIIWIQKKNFKLRRKKS